MIISIEDAKKIISSQVEQLTETELDTNNDGSIVINTRLYYWMSDKQIHDECEPKEVYEAWFADDSRD
jgi:hypothetical protein